jgi:hypothetical protein
MRRKGARKARAEKRPSTFFSVQEQDFFLNRKTNTGQLISQA